MSYKDCKFYEDSAKKGHCPFYKICDASCVFVIDNLKEDLSYINEMHEDAIRQLEEIEDNEEELEDTKEELELMTQENEEMIDYIKSLIDVAITYESLDIIPDNIGVFGSEWKHEILSYIRKKGKVMGKDINIVCKNDKYKPEYANPTDACMDLKIVVDDPTVPERWFDNMNYYSDANECWLFPGEKRLFGTGIQVAVPENYVMLLYPRSSTGSKLNIMLANTTGVIDTGYRDEVKLCLVNYGATPVKLEDGQRIAQFMIIPRPKLNLCVVEDNEEFRNGDRGGGFGSTGA